MISYLKGTLLDWYEEGAVIIDVNGVGYEVNVPTRILGTICTNNTMVELYTYLQVKEDGVSLYGFSSRDEMQLFKKIISVSGVGPKGALSILSYLNKEQFITAVLSDDDAAISKANGIGKKTAQKIVLELKDKFKPDDAFGSSEQNEKLLNAVAASDNEEISSMKNDTIAALVALGYSNSEAMKAVRSITITEDMSVDSVLRQALKSI